MFTSRETGGQSTKHAHLPWLGPHECQHTVLVVLKVSVEQRWPSLRISAVHRVAVGYQHLHTSYPPRQCSKVEGGGPTNRILGTWSMERSVTHHCTKNTGHRMAIVGW